MRYQTESQPIVRWAGSKKRQLSQFGRYIPQFEGKYIEPFAGSACVFFFIAPQMASINDLNFHLINFYRAVSQNPEEIYDLFFSIDRSSDKYYQVRDQYRIERNATKKAAFFMYLNRNCFNGIFRVNKSGHFNVPYSNRRVAPYPSREEFIKSAKFLSSASLTSVDFEIFCKETCASGDFVYIDPPYYVPDVRIFQEYTQTVFTEADTTRLIETLALIDGRGARFLCSYPKGDLTSKLKRTWESTEIRATRSVAGSAAARRSETEVLLANFSLN